MRTEEEEYEFIWTNHHIIMDGWCMGIIVNEFKEIYVRKLANKSITLPSVSPYSNYIKWLQRRNKGADVDYWSNYLASYEGLATFSGKSRAEGVTYDLRTSHMTIGENDTKQLKNLSVQYGVTQNTIIHCAWGILLAKFNNTNDVVFGSVVSGRPAEIDGIESMIGLFINTVPVRIQYDDTHSVADLLKTAQQQALDSQPHHYYPLFEIQAISELRQNLLDHILVFENFPIAKQLVDDDSKKETKGLFEITDSDYRVQTNYDLSVKIYLLDQLEIQFDYNSLKYEKEDIDAIISCFRNIVRFMAQNPNSAIKELSLLDTHQKSQDQQRIFSRPVFDTRYNHTRSVDKKF